MDKDKDKMQKNIDDLTEWQENQYNPGHWIGGVTPRGLITPRKPRILGVFIILVALGCFVGLGFLLNEYLDKRTNLLGIEHFYFIAQLTLLGVFSLLLFIGGILKVKK